MTPSDVRQRLISKSEIALLDTREEYAFAEGHPLFAANFPLARLETDISRRVPRLATCIVLYDDGEGYAERAKSILEALGYSNCHLLVGGLKAWQAMGYELFIDVNSYCKAFGELVESRRHTPSLSACEVRAMLDRQEGTVILDARTPDEFRTMSIPSARNVPGADLVLAARRLAPDVGTTVIVNCAGRTRSLIGTQSLINAGIPNPVFALRNGTIGWLLADLELARDVEPDAQPPALAAVPEALMSARSVSYAAGVRCIDAPTLDAMIREGDRTTYRFDLTVGDGPLQSRYAGFHAAAGGQLVQETDVHAPVRGARIVLWDETGVRAHMTASWLAQMAWDVYVVEASALPPDVGDPIRQSSSPGVLSLTPAELHELAERGDVTVVDLASSAEFRRDHIPDALFVPRSQLPSVLREIGTKDVVVTSTDGEVACWAASECAGFADRQVVALSGGTRAWISAGFPTVSLPAGTPLRYRDVYDRPYVGTSSSREAMQAYLDWEAGLVAQLERDGSHGFFVI